VFKKGTLGDLSDQVAALHNASNGGWRRHNQSTVIIRLERIRNFVFFIKH